MPFSIAARNSMLSGNTPDFASLHTADPGETGANEVAGGSPAYARKAAAFAAPSSGSMTANGTDPVFDVPAGTTVAYVGWWRAGVWQGSDPVTNEVYAVQGTYTLTDQTLSVT